MAEQNPHSTCTPSTIRWLTTWEWRWARVCGTADSTFIATPWRALYAFSTIDVLGARVLFVLQWRPKVW